MDGTCRYCKYYSARGRTTNGVWVQTKSPNGDLTGWCQHSPPSGARETVDNWPVVCEGEVCGQFEFKEVPRYRYYEMWYQDKRKECALLRNKLKRHERLHYEVGQLAPLVGKPTSSVRLRIIEAVKAALTTEEADV